MLMQAIKSWSSERSITGPACTFKYTVSRGGPDPPENCYLLDTIYQPITFSIATTSQTKGVNLNKVMLICRLLNPGAVNALLQDHW